jgi:hypothetical protein
MADDAVRVVYDHLAAKPENRRHVDLFIHSNGGSGTVPWRLVNLIREFADRFEVLIPHKAYSAATLTALGADQIVMHPMGELGPIDPSVANAFNPRDPLNNQAIPISVEDVLSYIALVKDDVGIRHEDELVHALLGFMSSPTHPVHPLALGNVKRHHARSKLVAKKLLLKHMQHDDEVKIDRIIDNLTSKLFYHGHPINRTEARSDLDLKIDPNPSKAVLDTMWELYLEYEADLQLRMPFDAGIEWHRAHRALSAGQSPQPASPSVELNGLKTAIIQSETGCDVFETDLKLTKFSQGIQEVISAQVLRREWTRQP